MDIYVFDKSFNMLGVIDRYFSLIWKREYYKVGTFELHAYIDGSLDLLQKGNILVKEDSPEEAVQIETITLNDEDVDTLVVKGRFIQSFLSDRIVWGNQSLTGTAEEVMTGFVQNNCISPTDLNRVIPNLVVMNTSGITIEANESHSYTNLVTLIEELATKYDVGWRILFDLPNQQYVFNIYSGKDSSINQDANPHVIFSAEYENVLKQTYTDSDVDYKNTALIGGQGEEPDRKFTTVNNDISGFERKEVFVDANDVSDKDENDVVIPEADYIKLLEERGKTTLAELKPIQTFESGISVLSNLIYKHDFDLGDMVTIQNNKWGLTINTRITTVEEVYENNKVDIRVNFGSNIPTIVDKIKRAVK